MSLIKYELLLSAIKHGSITAAAEEMGYTQSGVSHMINSLEDELGVKLIIRGRTGIKATPTGEILIPYISRVISENENFMQEVSDVTGLIKGKLTIGSFSTVSTFYLPEIISEFEKQYPNIDFELRTGTYEEIEKWITDREVDCGFVSLPTQSNLTTIPVIHDHLVVAVGKDYPHNFKDKKVVSLDDLKNVDHILIDGKSDYDIMRLFADSYSELRIKITTSDAYATVKMTENNLGVAVIPIHVIKEFKDSLDIYEIEEKHYRTLALAHLGKSQASPILKKFIEFISSKDAQDYNSILTE